MIKVSVFPKYVLNLTLVIVLLIFASCDNGDCDECFTPPQEFTFEIVDAESGENLFTNGTFTPETIKITNTLDDSERTFRFFSEDQINLIQIFEIGWETEIVNLEISVGNETLFSLYVDAQRTIEDCCSFTEFKEITIQNSEYEFNSESGVYTIFVE